MIFLGIFWVAMSRKGEGFEMRFSQFLDLNFLRGSASCHDGLLPDPVNKHPLT